MEGKIYAQINISVEKAGISGLSGGMIWLQIESRKALIMVGCLLLITMGDIIRASHLAELTWTTLRL